MGFTEALKIGITIIGSVSISGVVIVALSKWLGTIWSERILSNHKNDLRIELEKDIGHIKESLQTHKGEIDKTLVSHQGQIDKDLKKANDQFEKQMNIIQNGQKFSEQVFSSLFDKKISVYNDLMNVKTSFKKTMNEDATMEYLDYPPYPYIKLFEEVRELVEKNRLLISEELSIAYEALYSKVSTFLYSKNENEMLADLNSKHGDEFFHIMTTQDEKISREMWDKTGEEMNVVLKQIDIDCSKVRSILDSATYNAFDSI